MHLFSLPVRVYYEDTDAGGVVYHSNYFSFCERCRTEWLRSLGYAQVDLMKNEDLCFVVHKIEGKFLKSAKMDDELLVHLDLEEKTKTRLIFQQTITWKNALPTDKPSFWARVEIVCVKLSVMKPTALPQNIWQALSCGEKE